MDGTAVYSPGLYLASIIDRVSSVSKNTRMHCSDRDVQKFIPAKVASIDDDGVFTYY